MKLYQCSICGSIGHWGSDWQNYGSLILQDSFPDQMLISCSDACRATAEAKMEAKEIVAAQARRTHDGYNVTLSQEPVGYQPQPPQADLPAQCSPVKHSPPKNPPNRDMETSLLSLLADIRKAVGDPEGKLMQDELVERCRLLHDVAGRAVRSAGAVRHRKTQRWAAVCDSLGVNSITARKLCRLFGLDTDAAVKGRGTQFVKP